MSPINRYTSAFLVTLCSLGVAQAEDYVITLKDHQFSPHNLVIPAGQKVVITVKNLQSAPAEFQSDTLNQEQVVMGKEEIKVVLTPHQPGTYTYYDDFYHASTGVITIQ